ncbi:iron complex transport system ATP-binding protein [Altererythrobacter xiamenensis]|uniref:Iron complex transport system ATP-binding protein n=1 Tax=Altererythrobacter xiamenensis TaxID=1316679 RepID=A0A1Y6EB65_9SPHN|nr:ABC transporter ATP-binding protein [Altererythrobacter xiamenensis]SMQ58160.1 iron complex transport system ATP-binding protein [Altererythrobacter xiamenensis]
MSLVAEKLTIPGRLDEVSATLEPGRITAICGPNGAGKSSLLMALASLLDPVSGKVALDGEALNTLHPRARAQRIGYLPQEASVAWDVSVANLVRLGRMPWRDRGEQAVEAAIDAFALQALRHRPASQLSGGEKARALLARVLAGEPQWILADEPLAALDLSHQLTLLRHLRVAAEEGRGVALVLHDLAKAMNNADRVLVLKEGRLIADDAPEKALASDVIADVWGVSARWLGEPGARALVAV